jgi:hypothetical protein
MLDDLAAATIANGLTTMATMDEVTLETLGQRSRACWLEQLTPHRMWQRHLDLYDDAATDAGFAVPR